MENDKKEKEVKVDEKDQMKRYYVDFYDMFDGWGTFGFFTDRLFDELPDAIKLCDKLNEELDKNNKNCGEHYGVVDSKVNREVYCGQDEKYREKYKLSDLSKHISELIASEGKKDEREKKIDEKTSKKIDENASKKDDEKASKKNNDSNSKDRYQEVAEEIVDEIKFDLLDSTGFDSTQIENVLRRRFDIKNEETGRLFLTETVMFNRLSGETFTSPMFGILSFIGFDVFPIISGKMFPNYDIRNKYIGYTDNGVFHRVNGWTEFVKSVKRNPQIVLMSMFVAYAVTYTLLSF